LELLISDLLHAQRITIGISQRSFGVFIRNVVLY
jgi:hypothetical protein